MEDNKNLCFTHSQVEAIYEIMNCTEGEGYLHFTKQDLEIMEKLRNYLGIVREW